MPWFSPVRSWNHTSPQTSHPTWLCFVSPKTQCPDPSKDPSGKYAKQACESTAGAGRGAGKGSAKQGCVSSITGKTVKGLGFTEGDMGISLWTISCSYIFTTTVALAAKAPVCMASRPLCLWRVMLQDDVGAWGLLAIDSREQSRNIWSPPSCNAQCEMSSVSPALKELLLLLLPNA